MIGNARIIKRATTEVNAMSSESRKLFSRTSLARTLIACVAIVAVVLTASCGSRERQAERLYRKANQAVEDGNLDEAIGLFNKILDDYRDTETAGRAQEAVELYEGIAEAVKKDPGRRATEVMIKTARALESYRGRNRKFPAELAALVPRYLDAIPVDAWGQPLVYRVNSNRRGYVLLSLGSDGAAGGEGDARDIAIKDSRFVQRAAP